MLKHLVLFSLSAFILAGCASSQIKARKEQRDKASQTSKLYCDFVNGDLYPDVEVMLNLEMAKRCDNEKSFTITQYKTTNENLGIVYCCSMPDKEIGKEMAKEDHKAEPAHMPEAPKAVAPAKPDVKSEAKPEAKKAEPPPKAAAPAKPEAKKPANDDDLGD